MGTKKKKKKDAKKRRQHASRGEAGERGLLPGIIGVRGSEQFIVGMLIGAAAVYVLGDEKMRKKIIRAGMELYASVAGSCEDIREQMSGLRAGVGQRDEH